MISDEMAYRQYLDGQEQAADLLVERYGDPLVYYLHGYLKDIHRTGSFKAYLYKTARNLALRHKRKHRIPFLRLEELPFEPQSDGLADTELLRSERERQLYAALEQLKAEYREALYLVYWEDMSYQSAAAVMGKNVQQVTNLVHRGKKNLKGILERERFDHADD